MREFGWAIFAPLPKMDCYERLRVRIRASGILIAGTANTMARFILTLATACVLSGCASWGTPRPPAPTTEEIVQWSNEKVAAEEIIERMKTAHAVYRLPASELADLKSRGVPDKVIDYMQQTYIAAERWDEYQAARDQYFFYGWPGYPGFYHPFGPYWAPYPYRYRW